MSRPGPASASARPNLENVDAIHVTAVLEDCVDQLAILGRIMPGSYENRDNADEMVGEEISGLVEGQAQLENQYEAVMARKGEVVGNTKSAQQKREDHQKDLKAISGELKNSTHVLARSLKQSPLTPDNLDKVQGDRAFLQKVLYGTLLEMCGNGGFQTLVDAVQQEKEKKAKLQATIQREEEGRKRLKLLGKQLVDVKKEKESEIQQRNEMIAHLKDQVQELKAKTNMEGKYIKKSAEVSVFQAQKKCNMTEKEMKDEIETLKDKIDEETRVNAEIESFLRAHQSDLSVKVEYWMEKYETDVEAKQKELDILKASKAKDLERLQELTKLYSEYEQVVVEDRIDKEKARRKAEMEAEELASAVRIQSWFRGVMVRRGLGPYGKKKKKGKKGKKGKKKKK